MSKGTITISEQTRMRAALAVAIAADALQIAILPLFIEGAASPADGILDVAVAGILAFLLGWHWEFLPSFLAELVPGVDFIPFWTLAVGNVYRKSRRVSDEPHSPIIEGEPVRKG